MSYEGSDITADHLNVCVPLPAVYVQSNISHPLRSCFIPSLAARLRQDSESRLGGTGRSGPHVRAGSNSAVQHFTGDSICRRRDGKQQDGEEAAARTRARAGGADGWLDSPGGLTALTVRTMTATPIHPTRAARTSTPSGAWMNPGSMILEDRAPKLSRNGTASRSATKPVEESTPVPVLMARTPASDATHRYAGSQRHTPAKLQKVPRTAPTVRARGTYHLNGKHLQACR